MPPLTTVNSLPSSVANALAPAEGPKALPLQLLFGTATSYTFNVSLLSQQGWLSNVQCIFVDNSLNASALTINVPNVCNEIIPPNAQAFVPIPCPQNVTLTFTCSGGQTANVVLFNVPMPAAVWSINAGQTLPISGGMVQVQDVALEAAIVGGLMQSQIYGLNGAAATAVAVDPSGRVLIQPSEQTALTSHSVASTSATSATLIAAGGVTKYVIIQAPATADVWINLNGGTASVGGVDCIRIPQNTFWESKGFVPSTAITYFTGTAALTIGCLAV